MVTWDGLKERSGFFIHYMPWGFMDFVSPLESPLNCCPKFHFMHQWKPQPKGKKFPSHWSGIQEFIFRKVRSQAKLCYLGMLPKYRSVLFWITKPLVVTVFPDIRDEKHQYKNVCFTKEDCQVRYAFSLASLVNWTLIFHIKGGWDAGGHLSLFMIKWYSHVCWRATWWPTSPNISQIVCHKCCLIFSSLVCSPELHSREGHCLRPGHCKEAQWRSGTQLPLNFALTSLQSCSCGGFVLLCRVGAEWTLKDGWLVGQSRPYCWKLTGTRLTHCSQQGVFLQL